MSAAIAPAAPIAPNWVITYIVITNASKPIAISVICHNVKHGAFRFFNLSFAQSQPELSKPKP